MQATKGHLFELPPRAIKLIQRDGKTARLRQVVRQQTANADGHVIQTPGGIQTRTERKPKV